jgi:hypothetical protein
VHNTVRGAVNPLNQAALQLCNDYEYLGFWGDDMVPLTPDWNWWFYIRLKNRGKYAMVYADDGYQGERLPTQIVMDSSLVKRLGYMGHPEFRHLYVDDFWKYLGNYLGTLVYVKNVSIEHKHFSLGKAPEDELYTLHNSQTAFQNGRESYGKVINSDDFQQILKAMKDELQIPMVSNSLLFRQNSVPIGVDIELPLIKVLVMVVGNNFHDARFIENIISLKRLTDGFSKKYIVHFAGLSSQDDFQMYDEILSFRYKVVNSRYQLDKVCSFLESCNEKYDWYIKTRPDVEILQSIDFESLCKDSINARVREYCGPVKLEFGASIGGYGCKDIHEKECMPSHGNSITLDDTQTSIILDDMVYIFHKTILDKMYLNKDYNIYECQNEWFHTALWNSRNIKLNPCGIKMKFMKYNGYSISGHLNLTDC